ncbi:nuclear factor 7, brain-like [Myripristis murdjan]|uniref:Nuclear factor 7, brain-like n=1 Tax=Myripristis murdjan TaxID=586833 RepID=A0A668A9C4_9TELE|nr:nuclear factor 7, brain-like [Myripristis murdjan]
MSAASSLLSEEQFLCSICLHVFTDPVSTPCGHNFCKTCITQHWDVNTPCQCPVCKEVFKQRPELRVNTLVSEMAAPFRKLPDLRKTRAEIKQMIEKRQVKIQEIKRSVELSRKDAEREIADGVRVFTSLMQSVERGQAELIDMIEEKQKTTEKQAEGFIKELQQEISELMRRSSEVEQLSHTEDHLHLLQSFPSLSAPLHTKNWTEVRVHCSSHEGSVRKAVAQLEETLSKEMKKLLQAELKRVQHFEVDVTLDPDTAHPKLILSDDGKQVKHGDVKNYLPKNPERFSTCVSVLGKQSFSSGRFYFEVQVKGKTKWTLGVARASINRKRQITLNPQNGYWTVLFRNENEYTASVDPPVHLPLKSQPQKVGVFVDYEEGLVSFYDVDAAALIYSYPRCRFTEKLYPYLSPCVYDRGKNSAPLIITRVSH